MNKKPVSYRNTEPTTQFIYACKLANRFAVHAIASKQFDDTILFQIENTHDQIKIIPIVGWHKNSACILWRTNQL